jgi:hypothetical protein
MEELTEDDHRQADRQTDKQTDKQADRHINRSNNRQSDNGLYSKYFIFFITYKWVQ